MVAFFSKKLYFLLVRKTTAQKNNNYISTNWETLFEAGIKNTARLVNIIPITLYSRVTV